MVDAAASNPSAREGLTKRVIPHMRFSDGSASSMTPPPLAPMRTTYQPVQQAVARFTVEGSAIITGGSGVLGLSIARGLLEHGVQGLVLFDLQTTINAMATQPLLADLRKDFPDVPILTTHVDVTSEKSVDEGMDDAWARLPPVKHLICCAGIVGVVPALVESAEHWRQVVDVNLNGSFLCAKSFARRMTAAGTAGSIIFTSSLASGRTLFPQPQAAYNASKAGVVSMTKSLAAEWAGAGLRVNAIAPGYMDTILNEGSGLESARQAWMQRCPMGRMGSPEELVGVAVMLCSRAGSYITGAEIRVDGGSSAL